MFDPDLLPFVVPEYGKRETDEDDADDEVCKRTRRRVVIIIVAIVDSSGLLFRLHLQELLRGQVCRRLRNRTLS